MRKKRSYKRWTEEEVAYVRENTKKISTKEIAKHLGKTEQAVRDLRKRWNKQNPNDPVKNQRWSNKEIEFLRENSQKMTVLELSKILNRSVNAIASFKRHWNEAHPDQEIRVITKPRRLTEKEKLKISDKLGRVPLKQLAKQFKIKPSTIESSLKEPVRCTLDHYSALFVIDTIDAPRRAVYGWIRKGWLEAYKPNAPSKDANRQYHWAITQKAWRKFCDEHPECLKCCNDKEGIEWLKHS